MVHYLTVYLNCLYIEFGNILIKMNFYGTFGDIPGHRTGEGISTPTSGFMFGFLCQR
jgi:hypothetical protein